MKRNGFDSWPIVVKQDEKGGLIYKIDTSLRASCSGATLLRRSIEPRWERS
jgi:hypothetical protein